MTYRRDFGPSGGETLWRQSVEFLTNDDPPEIRIAHIDAGVAAHPALGYENDAPPRNLLIHEGVNLYDPERNPEPVAPVTEAPGRLEYPDHGVKTLSVLLGAEDSRLRGAAQGARVTPYRVANGPLFIGTAHTRVLAKALSHALALRPMPVVVNISMGNPGLLMGIEMARFLIGGDSAISDEALDAIDAAYKAGVIIVCSAGQVIDRVVYPARAPQTISVGGVSPLPGAAWRHYPPHGYAEPSRVDIWAQASDVNRAEFHRHKDGSVKPGYAEDFKQDGQISGTSYAAPQVAAAAALWRARYRGPISRDFIGREWLIVEEFRFALQASARKVWATTTSGARDGYYPMLDTEALLARAPDPSSGLKPKTRGGRY